MSGLIFLSESLYSSKVLNVGIKHIKENRFSITIHFLNIVDTFHRFFVVRSVLPLPLIMSTSKPKALGILATISMECRFSLR